MSRRIFSPLGKSVLPYVLPSCRNSAPHRTPSYCTRGFVHHETSRTKAGTRDGTKTGDQALVLERQDGQHKLMTSPDWISLALKHIGLGEDAHHSTLRKGNLSRKADRARVHRRSVEEEGEKNAWDTAVTQTIHASDILRSREPTVRRILAACIVRLSDRTLPRSKITVSDRNFLAERQLSDGHILGWARILMTKDTTLAFSNLWNLYEKHGRRAAPVFLLLQLLRRRHVDARALHIAMRRAQTIAEEERRNHGPFTNSVFILFVRLLRHARVGWPSGIPTITEMLISNFPPTTDDMSRDALATLTDMANSALQLLSLPSGLETFANVAHRKAGIVQLLEYMAVHKLHLNRTGYRAVVRTQLTEPKNSDDRLWAGLKALSWPPWKEDRTQVDSQITHKTHGMSQAMTTLMHMEAVGYAPYVWESAAKIYAGWDIDGTPTIQSRVLLGSKSTPSMIWAARILATRTAQEAWANYLAWKDEKQPQSPAVHEAIFRRLHEENRRLSRLENEQLQHRDAKGITAGDVREISPPPPSTHLYTYTSTPPPTPDNLYRKLKGEGVRFETSCLAFLVAHAPTLEHGLEYLRNEQADLPGVPDLSGADLTRDLFTVDAASHKLLTAYIEMLCRFARADLSTKLRPEKDPRIYLVGHKVKRLTGLAAALSLYLNWSEPSPEAWLALVASLVNPRTINGLSYIFGWSGADQDLEFRKTYTATKVLHELFRKRNNTSPEDDTISLIHVCSAHASTTFEAWMSLASSEVDSLSFVNAQNTEAAAYLSRSDDELDLRALFWSVVDDGIEEDTVSRGMLSKLTVPSPAVLHAYIRAVGWDGDYESLLDVLRWVVRHQDRLAHQAARDHNGQAMLRKCMVAVRVFMERTFVPPCNKARKATNSIDKLLSRLEQPAPPKLIEESKSLMHRLQAWNSGWPSDEETQDYLNHVQASKRFERMKRMYSTEQF